MLLAIAFFSVAGIVTIAASTITREDKAHSRIPIREKLLTISKEQKN